MLEPVFAIITELVIIVIITDYEASVPIVRQVSTTLLAASCMAFRRIHGCTNAFAYSIHDSKDMVDSLHQLKRDKMIKYVSFVDYLAYLLGISTYLLYSL